MSSYKIINKLDTADVYAKTDVPGEFRSYAELLGAEQIALSRIFIPPHSDFEQSTAHAHSEIEEIYIINSGTLTMRFDDDILKVESGSIVRVSPSVYRSHRNESDEPVEIWAISPVSSSDKADLVRDFWQKSPLARQSK